MRQYRTPDERLDQLEWEHAERINQLERNVRVLQWAVAAHGIGIAAIIFGVAG